MGKTLPNPGIYHAVQNIRNKISSKHKYCAEYGNSKQQRYIPAKARRSHRASDSRIRKHCLQSGYII